MNTSSLLDRRLIFVTGKGGVGKSTVATALGLVAARRGLRTIVAELASQDRVQRSFDRERVHFVEVELAPRLFTISIDPQHAMEEYLRIKTGAFGHLLSSSKLFHAFAMATPGMRELLTIGKVWELAQLERQTGQAPYDLVIVDAPASGHGVAILRTPRTFAEIAKVGPIARQGGKIAATIADREQTAVIAVTTAEEMPVNEAVALEEVLSREQLALELVIVNACYRARFGEFEIPRLRQALAGAGRSSGSPDLLARAALTAALSEHARAGLQRQERSRLSEGLDVPLIELPYVFAEEIATVELELLADRLAAGLAGLAAGTSHPVEVRD